MSFAQAEIRRLSRYGIVGLTTNLSLYLVFLLFLRIGLTPTLAAGICYGLGVGLSYMLNRRWTFASDDSHLRDLPKFALAYGIGLVSTLLTIAMLTLWMSPELAQLLNVAITALVIYGSLRLFRFGEQDSAQTD